MSVQLDIHQVIGQIAIHQTFSQMKMHQQPAVMDIHQQPAKIDIRTEQGELTIDQTASFADEGLMGPGLLSNQAARTGQQAALEYIGKIAADGDQLKSDLKGGKAFANLADKNSRPPLHEFNVGLIPSSSVTISYKPAEVRVNVQTNRPDIHIDVRHVEIQVDPGFVQIKMERYPSISIQAVGTQFNTKV